MFHNPLSERTRRLGKPGAMPRKPSAAGWRPLGDHLALVFGPRPADSSRALDGSWTGPARLRPTSFSIAAGWCGSTPSAFITALMMQSDRMSSSVGSYVAILDSFLPRWLQDDDGLV